MSYNGSGLFGITTGGQPVVGGTTIDATVFNNLTADLATGLSTAICKDGQTTVTANLPMNSKKLTGLADGSSRSDSSTIGNIVDGTGVYVATVGGTVDVIILTTAPAITAYSAGQHFYFIAAGANTTNVTVNVSGMGAKALTKNGTTALVANDILANMMVRIIYDGTRFILGAHLTADTVTLTGTQTLTNKTLTTPAITSGVLTTSTVAADPLTALGIASRQYVDNTVGVVQSYSSTNSLGAGVRVAVLSGASFVFTLPAAASNTSRIVNIIHRGTSLTQVYTVTGNAAETIVASDGTANTYLLYTNGEQVQIVCDGTGWVVLTHLAETPWVDAGAMTITGSTSDPTKPTTPDYDKVLWKRSGNQMFVKWVLQISSAAGSAAGTGSYLFALPTNLSFDATIHPAVATPISGSVTSESITSMLHTSGYVAVDSVSDDFVQAMVWDSTKIHLNNVLNAGSAVIGSTGYALTNAELGYFFSIVAKHANWRS